MHDVIHNNLNGLSIVISGSFRKCYEDICRALKRFESLGIRVLSPQHSDIVNPGDDFVLLETDKSECPQEIEREHLNAILRADALYLYNADGYVGPSSAMEMGWALAFGRPVYTKEACVDTALKCFVGKPATPEEVKTLLLERKDEVAHALGPESSLRALQGYVRKVLAARGFAHESAQDKVLLMLEEFGELAKALRKHVGLKIDKDKAECYAELKYELADVLMYLLDLANTCDIDLSDAFKEKEQLNARRHWAQS